MDESVTRTEDATTAEPVESSSPAQFARGSGHIGDPERTEHSVMEGLPAAKAERIAAMRRELADLQRQLIDAQQRIATELQGRADDAERIDDLETRAEEAEARATQLAKELDGVRGELGKELERLRAELASATTSGEELRRSATDRDAQLEDLRHQHQAMAQQLDAQSTSLRDTKLQLEARERELGEAKKLGEQLDEAKNLVASRDAELATLSSMRDTLKTERDDTRRELDAMRGKVRDVAEQLVRCGQDLIDGGPPRAEGVSPPPPPAMTNGATNGVSTAATPPPIPRARASQPPPAREVILEVAEAKPSRVRSLLLVLAGVIVGAIVASLIAMATSSANASNRDELGAAPTPTPAVTTPPAQAPAAGAVEAPAANPEPAAAAPAATAEPATEGVLVLPEDVGGHRVFLDGKVIDVKGARAVVPCGPHEVRIGSHGPVHKLDVACGAETAVPADPQSK